MSRSIHITVESAFENIIEPKDKDYKHLFITNLNFDFDLSPVDENKRSIHCLCNCILLNVFLKLSPGDRIRAEGVCRRWRSIIYYSFKFEKKAEINLLHYDALDRHWQYLYSDYSFLIKYLLLAGNYLIELEFFSFFIRKRFIFKLISQLCPNLRTLNMNLCKFMDFESFDVSTVPVFANLKEFNAQFGLGLCGQLLSFILTNSPNLEHLDLSFSEYDASAFQHLPDTIKTLKIRPKNLSNVDSFMHHIIINCPNLETLCIHEINISTNNLNLLAINCKKLSKLNVNITDVNKQLSLFKKFPALKFLTVQAPIFTMDISLLFSELQNMNLENLKFSFDGFLNPADFKVLKNVKGLDIWFKSFSEESLLTIGNCENLERLKFDSVIDHVAKFSVIEKIIDNSKSLTLITIIMAPSKEVHKFVLSSLQKNFSNRRRKIRMVINTPVNEGIEPQKYDEDGFQLIIDPIFLYGYTYSKKDKYDPEAVDPFFMSPDEIGEFEDEECEIEDEDSEYECEDEEFEDEEDEFDDEDDSFLEEEELLDEGDS